MGVIGDTRGGTDPVSPWFWFAVAAAVLYGLHQITTRLAATRIGEGVGAFLVEAAAVVTPPEEDSAPAGATAGVPPRPEAPAAAVPVAAAPRSPLLPMMARHGASSAPKTLLNRKTVIAARKKTIR